MTKEELKPIDVSKYTVTENGDVIKDKLKQEAEEWINKWELCNKCDHKVQCIEDNAICPQVVERAYLASAEPREKRIAELETQIEQLQKINNEQKETLKKVRVALIQERTANIMNYGKGGVEMFESMFEILIGVSN